VATMGEVVLFEMTYDKQILSVLNFSKLIAVVYEEENI